VDRNIRKFRFKTRTLLLAMVPVAILCLWPGRSVVSYVVRQYALGQIRSTGGTVYAAERGYALKLDRSQLLHLSALTDVGSLDLAQESLTDEDLSRLRPLRELVFLDLSENPISDLGLESIEQCHRLRFLALQDNAITSAGLKHLAQMSDLENLVLDGTLVDDDGLKHLRNCNSLRELTLYGTKVTAGGIKHLVELQGLSKISVPKEWSPNTVAELMAERPNLTVIQQRVTIPR
jgi:hypothetical protein